MIRKKNGDLEFLQFEIFLDVPELTHGIFMRHGGVSQPPFHSLNAGGNTGDSEACIIENRQRMLNALGIDDCISSYQVHEKKVVCIEDGKDPGLCDGMMTSLKNKGLLIKHADCQAAILYDPINRVVANVHCGWRGQVQNIYKEAIEQMKLVFGCCAENILVGISPSLGPDHAEFTNYKKEFPEAFWEFQVRPFYFDLWAIAEFQLQQAGVLLHHIQTAKICTYRESNDFFSYRRNAKEGRNATIVALASNHHFTS